MTQRLGRTMRQITSINRERIDVFERIGKPGVLVVYMNPARAADERLIKYVQARFAVENLAVRKRAMVDYLLVILTDWSMVAPAEGEAFGITEEVCPMCEGAGQLEYEPEQQVAVDKDDASKGTITVAATMEACPMCEGAGMVPVEPEPVALPEGVEDALLRDSGMAMLEPDDPEAGQPDQYTTVDREAQALPGLVAGEPLPISRKNLEALGMYYLAQICQAIFAKFKVGEAQGANSSSA